MENDVKKPRNPNDLLIIQNIDTEDHEWQYDAIKTPLPYFIRAGETREMPFYIARHGVEKLIDKILQKEGKNHMNPLFREEKINKIVLGLKHINYIREKTPNELALEAMQRKKDSDPFEELLKKREIEHEQLEKARIESAMPAAPLLQTVGTPVVAPVIPVTQPVVEQTSLNADLSQPMAADPARSQIYSLIASKLHMDMTHVPTREKFDSMSVDQLKSEFSSQLPELVNPAAALVPDAPEAPVVDTTPLPQAPVMPAPVNDGSVLAGLLQ